MQAEGTTLPLDEPHGPLGLIDGRFRLLRLLATGGMGELYLATATDPEIEGLEQLVVLKRILPAFAKDRDVVTMFLTEAHIAARLDHPNVVRVYDIGRADGSLYFTMEYLHGTDLGRLFDAARRHGGGFALGHTINIIIGVCAGLHFAHDMCRVDGRPMGIVHRDVSPGNVFVTFDGEVKLVDFGIAKVLSSSRNTQAGMLKGKAAYMSPEQVRGDPVDRRSDIFAIGILLFEMVTLTHLFDGENEYATMEQIATGRIPMPSSRRRGIAPALEGIILRTLSVRPEDRYPTAIDLAEALVEFVRTHDVRMSTYGLKQAIKRLVGEAEYPWYLEEEGPDEREAVRKWYASALPEGVTEEVEDFEISLTDMVEVDDSTEEQGYAEQYDDDEEPPEEVTRIAAAPSSAMRAARARTVAPEPPRPRPPRFRPRDLAGIGLGALAIVVLLTRACRKKEEPPPPPVIEAPAIEAPRPAPAPRPVALPPAPAPVIEAPPPEPAKEVKKPAKKQAGKKSAKQK